MANGSLENTRKQLDALEAKVKSLTQVLGQLKDASNGDTQLLAYFTNVSIEINKLVEQAKLLKTSLSGIGSSGANVDAITEQTRRLTSAFDTQLNSINNVTRALGDRSIIPPTSFSSDMSSNTKSQLSGVLEIIKSFANKVNSAVNKVISVLRGMLKVVTTVFNAVGKLVTTVGDGIKKLINLFGGLGNRVRGTAGDFNFFRNSATELRSKIMLLKGAFNTLFNNSMVNQSKKMMSSVLSMSVIIGNELTNNTLEWAKSMEQAFGVDAKGLIADLGEITGVLSGLGMKAQDVADGGTNLVMMSRYLGMMGMAGGDADQVMSKLTSGMKGMTASIDDLGLSVREAEMDSFLKDLKKQGGEFANIGTSFANLNEEARVYVRYASLIQQFLENFGKFDASGNYIFDVESFQKSLNSVTGRLGLLKSAWSGFTTTVGTGIAKIGALLAGYLIPVIRVIQSAVERVFAWFSNLTGINFEVGLEADVNSLDYDTSGTEKATENTEELNEELKEVEKNANKAKGSLQGFDRVNNVTSSSGSDSSSGSEDEFDYSSLSAGFGKLLDPLETEYGNFLDNIDKKNKEYTEKLKKGFYNLVDNLKNKAKELTGREGFDLGFDFPQIAHNFKTVWENIKKLIPQWGTFFIDIGLRISDDINIGKIITVFTTLINKVSELASVFSNVAIPILTDFYEKNLKPIVETLGKNIANKLNEWISNISGLIAYWSNGDKAGKEFAKTLDGLWKSFNGVFEHLAAILGTLVDIIKELWPTVKELVASFGEFAKNELLPWLLGKLKDLRDWLSENKERIASIIKVLTSIAWAGFKIFVELVGKLIDLCVKHPGVVVGFFTALLGLKITTWFVSMAIGIAGAITKLVEFGALFKSGGALAGVGAKLSGLMSSAGGAISSAGTTIKGGLVSAGSTVVGGLGSVGTALGSTATTAGGLAAAGGASIAGVVGGLVGVGAGIKDLVDASKANNEEEKKEKQWSGGTKIGMVGAGAATGAAIGSIIPGVGTAIGAAVGAGVGGIGALLGGSDISVWIRDAWENHVVPFFTDTVPEFFSGAVENIKTFFTETLPTALGKIGGHIYMFFTETIPNFFSGLINGIGTFFTEIVPNAIAIVGNGIGTFFTKTIPNFFSGLINGIVSFFTESVPNAISAVGNGIKRFFTETIPNLFSGLLGGLGDFLGNISMGFNSITGKSSATKAKTVTSHAVGGSIGGGQLFIANENGQPELIGNIDGSPKTNVANNNMIIDAMTNGVFTGVYNALAEVNNQRANSGATNAKIEINGFGLIDSSVLSELARMLAPYQNSNNSNIANVGFSI
jgi:phage-related protein